MRGLQVAVGTILTILFLSAAVYLWSVDMWNYVPKSSPADFGMIGQLILSISKVDIIDASQANLPWSGETWLINLVVTPQEAESIVAKLESQGYIEDTIPKEQIASNGKQAMYDIRIRITPVVQQCIYGPDPTTMKSKVPVKALYKDFDLGSGVTCPHSGDWKSIVDQYASDLLGVYDAYTYVCKYYCGPGLPKHAYVVCSFVLYKDDPGRTGIAGMSLESLYVKDKITVTAGPKSASGTAEDTAEINERYGTISSENPSTILYYGSTPVGKVDLAGFLMSGQFCPDAGHYYIANLGDGWKVVPDTLWSDLEKRIDPIEVGQMPVASCTYIDSWSSFDRCKSDLKSYVDSINASISSINTTPQKIKGLPVTRPAAEEYSASTYFAVEPEIPVAYAQYRMYLKASWVGILISTAKPQIDNIYPTSISLTGPESKDLRVTVRNVGDEGGIIVQVSCSGDFLVDGKSESSRTVTLQPQETRDFTFSISYGGVGTSKASGTCMVVAKSSANPNISTLQSVTVVFTPKGIYPPNTTVCISSTAYAKTDSYGNIVPGTEKSCPQGAYCEDTPSGAKCTEEITPPTGDEVPIPPTGGGGINLLLVGLVAAAIVIALIIAIVA